MANRSNRRHHRPPAAISACRNEDMVLPERNRKRVDREKITVRRER
jgi:hypothetical protein